MDLKQYVTIVPDYPKEGVQFKDITTLMDKGDVYRYATDQIVEYAKEKQIDLVVGPEARGFIIGCPVAYALGVGFAAKSAKKASCLVKLSKWIMAWNMEKTY